MARTAPFPNLGPIPGMCPSVAIKAGGDDDGGGSGRGYGSGGGDNDGGGDGGGDDIDGDQKNAPDHDRYPECGTVSHPIDVVTGRVFTHPTCELFIPGPLPMIFERAYSSTAKDRDVGLGFGWAHAWGWEVEVRRHRIMVWSDRGVAVPFPKLSMSNGTVSFWGWHLHHDNQGFILDADDGVYRRFSLIGKRFLLTTLADRNNNRIRLNYDQKARLESVVNDAGQTAWIHSTPEGRIASIEVRKATANGRSITFAKYAYAEAGTLSSATDAEGYVSRYAYDEDHRLTADTDRTGLTFHFRYDSRDRGIECWGDYGDKPDPSLMADVPKWLADGKTRAKGIHHVKIDFGQDGCSEVADSTQVRRFFGNKHGLLDKRVEGGSTVTATYSFYGYLLSRTDPTGATTTYVRDWAGRELARTDPLGRTTRTEREWHGLPERIIDPAGGITTYRRDKPGNALEWIDPTGAITTATYEKRGLITLIQGPTGGKTRRTYDTAGNLVEEIAANGGVWKWTYDPLGRCTSETDPLGATTRFSWSDRGDLVGVVNPAGGIRRFVYDGERRLIEVIDPLEHVMRQAWGGYHKLVEITDANGETARFRYNREGELGEIYNGAGEVHRLIRDSAGLIIEERTFDGRRLTYRHDRAGRLTRFVNGEQERTDLVYNEAGEMTELTLPDESVQRFAYDLLGDVVRMTWPDGELTLDRDAVGRIVRETQMLDGETHTVEVKLDPNGDRVERRTSLGFIEGFERDAMGARTRTVLDARHTITHARDLLGREVSAHLPGGGQIENAYGPTWQLARRWVIRPGGMRPLRLDEPGWSASQPAELTIDKNYVYDLASALTDVWDRRRGWTQYEHDPGGRLICAFVEKGAQEMFRYDAASNLFEAGPEAAEREYGPGGRLVRRGTTTYGWDTGGRLADKRTRGAGGRAEVSRYNWNAAGLLASVRLPEGKVIAFSYDPLARLLARTVAAPPAGGGRPVEIERTRFVWDGDVVVHAICTRPQATGEPLVEERTYCFDDDSFVPRAHADMVMDHRDGDQARRWVFYVNDPIETPEELVSARGEPLGALDRQAWGRTEATPGSKVTTLLRFQGQIEDKETGLFYNRFRYYDPEIGGFISPDPIGLAGGLRLYGYVPAPNGWVDPSGLHWNYRLVNQGKVYYVGRARDQDSMKDVARRHGETKGRDGQRFDETQDRLEQITPTGTPRDAVRGVEEMSIQEHGTKIGRRMCNGNQVRGNNISGISPKNGNCPVYMAAGKAHVASQGVKSVAALKVLDRYGKR